MSVWNYSDKDFTSTAANTYEYSGVSFTVPANQVYEFIAQDKYSSGNPIAIAVTDNNSSIGANSSIIAENAQEISQSNVYPWARSVTGMTVRHSSTNTYYIWVKRASASVSRVALAYRRIY